MTMPRHISIIWPVTVHFNTVLGMLFQLSLSWQLSANLIAKSRSLQDVCFNKWMKFILFLRSLVYHRMPMFYWVFSQTGHDAPKIKHNLIQKAGPLKLTSCRWNLKNFAGFHFHPVKITQDFETCLNIFSLNSSSCSRSKLHPSPAPLL